MKVEKFEVRDQKHRKKLKKNKYCKTNSINKIK